MRNQVEFEHVWKRYELRRKRGRIRVFFHEWMSARRGRSPNAGLDRDFWALRDVSLSIARGDSLGIIGDNGAGKSTFLKLIAGVTYPTRGFVKVRGRVGALVDIGAGMHPELTGFENIYLYGAVLGLPRREIRARFDDIVDFSELSKFLDVPIKRYSAGMKIRLGFAIAAFLYPDILLIDEVLAVGDIAFQRKCIDHIQKLQMNGTTVVYVSHDLQSVERICAQAFWINEGRLQVSGPTAEIIRTYRGFVEERFIETHRRLALNGAVKVERVTLADSVGTPRSEFGFGEDVLVLMHYTAGSDGAAPIEFHLKIVDSARHTLILASSDPQMVPVAGAPGVIQCQFKSIPLAPGTYQVWGQVLRLPDHSEEFPWQPLAVFDVPTSDRSSLRTVKVRHPSDWPVLDIPTHWSAGGG